MILEIEQHIFMLEFMNAKYRLNILIEINGGRTAKFND